LSRRGPRNAVEAHPQSREIAYLIISGTKLADISRQFRISEDSLSRFKAKVLPQWLAQEANARDTVRQWHEDLRKAVNCQCEDAGTRDRHFWLPCNVLRLAVVHIDHPDILNALLEIYPGFSKDKELASRLIEDIRKDYHNFEERLISILVFQYNRLRELGLSEKAAAESTSNWMSEQIEAYDHQCNRS